MSQCNPLSQRTSAAALLRRKDFTLFATLWSQCLHRCPMISPAVFRFSSSSSSTLPHLHPPSSCGIRIPWSQDWIFIKLKSTLKVYLTAVCMWVCSRLKGLMTRGWLRQRKSGVPPRGTSSCLEGCRLSHKHLCSASLLRNEDIMFRKLMFF